MQDESQARLSLFSGVAVSLLVTLPASFPFLHAFLQIAIILFAFVIAMAQMHFNLNPWLYHPGPCPGSVLWVTFARIPELLSMLPHTVERHS